MIILLALNVGIVHATSFSGGTSEDGQALEKKSCILAKFKGLHVQMKTE
jgi:hypothetical protein